MASVTKQELDLSLLEKLYQNLVGVGKIVRRLLLLFFTLMILLSVLTFEPEMFGLPGREDEIKQATNVVKPQTLKGEKEKMVSV